MSDPVGIISEAKDRLRTMLANCTAFREWDGASYSVAQAKDRIYLDALPPPSGNAQEYTVAELFDLRPYAVVYKAPHDGVRVRVASSGTAPVFLTSGTLIVKLVRNVPDADANDPGKLERDFENMVGKLISSGDVNSPGLLELVGTAEYLPLLSVHESGADRAHPDDVPGRGDYQEYWLQIEWGSP